MKSSSIGAAAACLMVMALIVERPTLLTGQETRQQKPASRPAELDEKEQLRFYQTQVEPILRAHCFKCHDQGEVKGGLKLSSREAVLRGGETGPAVELERPEQSLLLEAINYDSYEMPPSGKLPQAKINILTRWVQLGIPGLPLGQADAESDHQGARRLGEQAGRFWSFQRPRRPAVPPVEDLSWVKTPIDAFVLARLEAAGLKPAGPASKEVWLRRAYYDLIGLPPSPEQVRAFLADDSDKALEKVVDRLLASPHYGERWARHWLDLVRYAETNSYERDNPKPHVWRYRDYVIRSLNQDKPYDHFIREQLAGDEIQPVTRQSLIATGYYRLGIWDDEPSDPMQALYDDLDDILATTGQVFLGLTINCARCHEHKLDPIPQEDYYRMVAFFNGVTRYGVRGAGSVEKNSVRPIATEQQKRQQAAEVARHQQQVKQNDQRIKAIEDLVRDDFVPVEIEEFRHEKNRLAIVKKRVPKLLSEEKFAQYQALVSQRSSLRRFRPSAMDMALCVTEIGAQPRATHVLVRGNPHVTAAPVEPGFLSALNPPEPVIRPPAPDAATCGRRLALANWIASRDNPLTARVMVNRIWQHHFGRGIVRSPNNFGMKGVPPTHPQLLDWLACEFMQRGWRLKTMHKLIMLSNVYQMGSQAYPKGLERDPENNLMWRFNMRRLSAEEIRDSILAVNGSLNRQKMYGPSIYPSIPAEVLAGQSRPGSGWGQSSPEDQARRSIYIHIKRSLVTPILASFDVADTDTSCPVRFATTQPTQALGMLNSEFVNRQARVFADFLRREAGSDAATQVRLALQRTLQREPTRVEVERGVKLLDTFQQQHAQNAQDALTYFCVVALNLNEFLYLD